MATGRRPHPRGDTDDPRRDGAVRRLTPNDLTTLLSDRGPAPMNIAAVLVVDGGSRLDPSVVVSAVRDGAQQVPRLRQRLRAAPFGCGRPYWRDDDRFDVARHLTFEQVESDEALLDRAAELACHALPRDRPLWAAHWFSGLPGGEAALVFVTHHVLTDGIGGLAVLAALSDGTPAIPVAHVGASAPTRRALATEAWHDRLAGVRSVGPRLRLVRSGLHDLGARRERPRLCPRTAFNRPTGPRRRVAVLEAPLGEAIAAAHRHGATLNDLLLSAVAGAMRRALADRGGPVDSVVLSVPYSSRTSTTPGRLGNETGVVPFRIPVGTDALDRLERVADLTRQQRGRPRAASAAPLGVVFRGLARAGLLQWFVDHQRLVNSFVTNVRGPSDRLTFCGREVTRLLPIAVTPGNVAVTFDVLSYAGTLSVCVVTDPDVVADREPLMAHLRDEMDLLLR
ncbi:wax ester/triacylglycerol synthase family O-acyltransferase [Terrabacter koreensis]